MDITLSGLNIQGVVCGKSIETRANLIRANPWLQCKQNLPIHWCFSDKHLSPHLDGQSLIPDMPVGVGTCIGCDGYMST